MHRIDQATAVGTLPTPGSAGTFGYFTNGNPTTGSPATILDADWANNIQEELMSILTAAGISQSKTANNQVLTALYGLFSAPVVGSVRNAKMSVTTAGTSATFTADELVVETALGGTAYKLASYSEVINLSTTDAGGMDTGSAPVSGYVALYAIYNPTTSTASILAVDTTSAVAPNIYGGSHMPSGYTASSLISIWPTNSSSQFVIGLQTDRILRVPAVTVLNTVSPATTPTSISLSSAVPKNALIAYGWAHSVSTLSTGGGPTYLYPTSAGVLGQVVCGAGSSSTSVQVGMTGTFSLQLLTAQTMYYETYQSAECDISITGYSF